MWPGPGFNESAQELRLIFRVSKINPHMKSSCVYFRSTRARYESYTAGNREHHMPLASSYLGTAAGVCVRAGVLFRIGRCFVPLEYDERQSQTSRSLLGPLGEADHDDDDDEMTCSSINAVSEARGCHSVPSRKGVMCVRCNAVVAAIFSHPVPRPHLAVNQRCQMKMFVPYRVAVQYGPGAVKTSTKQPILMLLETKCTDFGANRPRCATRPVTVIIQLERSASAPEGWEMPVASPIA